jgi:hypothetical protein
MNRRVMREEGSFAAHSTAWRSNSVPKKLKLTFVLGYQVPLKEN